MAAGYYHFDSPFLLLLYMLCWLWLCPLGLLIHFTFLQADELVFEAIVQVPDRSVSTSLYYKISRSFQGLHLWCFNFTALCLTKELSFGN